MTGDWTMIDPQLVALLDEVLDVIRGRNATPASDTPAGGWPSLLLLPEEYQELRAAAGEVDEDTAKHLDRTLERIVACGRQVHALPGEIEAVQLVHDILGPTYRWQYFETGSDVCVPPPPTRARPWNGWKADKRIEQAQRDRWAEYDARFPEDES